MFVEDLVDPLPIERSVLRLRSHRSPVLVHISPPLCDPRKEIGDRQRRRGGDEGGEDAIRVRVRVREKGKGRNPPLCGWVLGGIGERMREGKRERERMKRRGFVVITKMFKTSGK